MIQIYSPGNNAYDKNGNAVLHPVTCQVSAELNGSWMLELEAPIDADNIWKLIEVGAVVKAPSFNGDQLFRIRQTEKKDSGVHAIAEPIFLDAVGDCFLLDIRPTNKNGQQALDMILAPNDKYSGSSDITRTSTAYYVRKNALEAIAGEDNGFLTRWGGEVLYNNYQIIINDRVGGDYGASLLYGKNIPVDGMSEAVNMEGVVTRIVPKAYNGYLLEGSTPWVDSPIINAYPTIMTKVIDYDNIRLASDVEGDDTEGLIICDNLTQLRTALQTAAEEEFTNGIDKPAVSIEADMVMLANTVEYRDYKDLEQVSLGDTIHCKHNRLGIITDARIVGIVYDCVRKAVTEVTIGEPTASFMDRVASTVSRTEKAIKPGGTVRAEQVQGFIDGVYAQLRVQNTVARRQDARAILFEDLDPSSPTYGALAIGTQGWQISKTRTADDRDWVWSTAATASGIVADAISTGTLQAIDITGVNITGSTVTGNTISGGTITGTEISGGSLVVQGPDDEDPDTYDDKVTIKDGYIDIRTVYKGTSVTPPKTITARQDAKGVTYNGQEGNTTYTASYDYDGAVVYKSGSPGRERSHLKSPQIYATRQISGTETRVWNNIFVADDTYTTGVSVFAGHITNGAKAIDFFVPLPSSAVGLTCYLSALPTNLSVRGTAGYINSKQYLNSTDINEGGITIAVRNGGLAIRLPSTGTYSNCTNNTPVAVQASFTFNFY